MKNISLILALLLLFIPLKAENKKSKSEIIKAIRHYQRLMESAQPTPDLRFQKQDKTPWIMSNNLKLPLFLNSNTIDSEAAEYYKMQNESSVAINPTNPKNMIASAVDYRNNSATWVYVSDDAGKTWRNVNLGRPYPNWRSSNDPSVYFALDGTGYLCYGGFGEFDENQPVNVGENGVFIAKTTDGGKTWKAHIPVIVHLGMQTLDSLFEDKYYVHVDNSPTSPYFGTVYIPWKRVTPRDSATQIVLSRSIDKGESWSLPVAVSNRLPGSSEDTTFGQSFPLAATGPNGELYVVWNHGIEHGVGFAKSTDGGLTFSEPRIIHKYNIFGRTKFIDGQGYRHVVKDSVRAEAYPVIVCDITNGPRRGYLYLCWAADNVPNIYFSRSTDGGNTWSNPIIVHSDTTNDQFWPWMALDPLNGDLAVMYFDSRNCPDNLLVECYVSYSSDGGLTWTDRRAADQPSNLRLNPFRGNAFAGDYSGCAFYDGVVYPTWVDMRNAVLNLLDSDVFTAIVNTRAPLPVENLTAKILPESPTTLELNWENPTHRSFGQPLSSNDFQIFAKRNDGKTFVFDGSTQNFTDTNLVPYQKYEYEFYVVSGKDTSISRTVASFAGGAKEPAEPKILSSKGSSDYHIKLNIKIPTLRADNFTPLANAKYIYLYRDGLKVQTIEINPSDTSKTLEIFDSTEHRGFYVYSATIVDIYGNESKKSERIIAYSDEIRQVENYSENFDGIIPKYFIGGSWQKSNEIYASKPYSFSNSPNRKYENGQCDTLLLFPFIMNGTDVELKFIHSAIIANNDFATVEYSRDNGNNWTNDFSGYIAQWKKQDYEFWKDNYLNEQDLKQERLIIPASTDTIFIRFRFYSNQVVNDLGWYIDDIEIREKTLSVQNFDDLNIYPNPAKEFLKIENSTDIKSIKLISSLGNTLFEDATSFSKANEYILSLSEFASGNYYLIITDNSGNYRVHKFIIAK